MSGEIFYDHLVLLSGDIRLCDLGLCDSFFDAIYGIKLCPAIAEVMQLTKLN